VVALSDSRARFAGSVRLPAHPERRQPRADPCQPFDGLERVHSVDVVGGRDGKVGRGAVVAPTEDRLSVGPDSGDSADAESSRDTADSQDPKDTFEEFYRLEFGHVRALARVLAGSTGSDDVAQEAMLVAYRRWREVSTMTDPAMWVRRVCANLATSQLRRRTIEARALLRLGARATRPVALEEPEETFWSSVRTLPRRQAQVVALYYLYDLGVAEVAATLQMTDGTVKTHLSRARKTLAARLDIAGGEQS
jgi:RNA polymerase sigma factor (sigma-70 family)